MLSKTLDLMENLFTDAVMCVVAPVSTSQGSVPLLDAQYWSFYHLSSIVGTKYMRRSSSVEVLVVVRSVVPGVAFVTSMISLHIPTYMLVSFFLEFRESPNIANICPKMQTGYGIYR